jgi:amino acid adenylation domain-containing protein
LKTLIELLSDFRSLGILLSVDGERLICNAPKGVVTPEIKKVLADRKPEILAFLRESASSRASSDKSGALIDLALARSQRRLWFLAQMEPDNPVYNVVIALRLTGKLNRAALERSLHTLVERHESLRTSFYAREGIPFARVLDGAAWKNAFIDLSTIPEVDAEEETRRLSRLEARKPFDLGAPSLFRASLLRISEQRHVLLLVVHHIVADGWSLGVIARELGTLYAALASGQQPVLPGIDFQYRDYVRWEQGEGEKTAQSQMPYWLDRLSGSLPTLALPGSRRRPSLQTFNGKRLAVRIEPLLGGKIRELCRASGATPYMLLLAAFNILLARYTGIEDVLVGSGASNRHSDEVAPLIGFFVNTLVLRTDLSGNPTFEELLSRTKETTTSAFAHQRMPFDLLVEKLQPERRIGHGPLVQVMFTFQNLPIRPVVLSELTVEPEELDPGIARTDLSIEVWPDGESFRCDFEFNTDIFDDDAIRAMQGHFINILQVVTADPSVRMKDITLLSKDERRQILVEWNRTSRGYPKLAVHRVFEEYVELIPDAMAIKCALGEVTYRELNRIANAIAHALLALPVPAHSFIAVFAPGSPLGIAAFLGILKAGHAYLPIDAGEPVERLNSILSFAGSTVLLATNSLREQVAGIVVPYLEDLEQFLPSATDRPVDVLVGGDDPAYLMFTSGSTGEPKGVVIPHRGIVRLVKNSDYIRWGNDEVFLQVSPLSFDGSTFDIWGALLNGACLALLPPGRRDPQQICFAIRSYGVTTVMLTAALLHFMIDEHIDELAPLRQLLGAGDVLSPVHIERLMKRLPRVHLVNAYGPTENSVLTCCHAIQASSLDGSPIPIGRPIANTRVFILDEFQQPVPCCVAGELYAAGDGLGLGYLNAPTLTAERFERLHFEELGTVHAYRTGDMARYRSDGVIEFLGRRDKQIKLRGYRVELGGIEQALLSMPSVRAAVVSTRTWPDGDKRLAAYVAPANESGLDPQALRAALQKLLPSYQIPSCFAMISEVPRTTNGKVDYAALESLPLEFSNDRQNLRPPSTEIEKAVASILAELLKLESISGEEDFFALGGHSLLAMQLISRISSSLGVKLSVATVFQNPTVEALSKEVEDSLAAASSSAVTLGAPGRNRTTQHPLSRSQRRLWFLNQLDPGNAVYNIAIALTVDGTLIREVLERSLKVLVERHESLRTRFLQKEGVPYAIVEDALGWQAEFVDYSSLSPTMQQDEALRFAREAARKPLLLDRGPLFRASLLRKNSDQHVIVLVMHHIISDGWSLGVLAGELGSIYQAFAKTLDCPLDPPQFQFRDFVAWEERQAALSYEADLQYWRQKLAGDLPLLTLPADHVRPALQTFNGQRVSAYLSEELVDQLQKVSRQQNATFFMILLAAFNVLLRHYSGQKDILVGTPTAGRLKREFEGVIGFFINNLVLRTDLGANPSFAELVQRVRKTALEAFEHQSIPFDHLVEVLQPERSLDRSPIFQVMFTLQNAPLPRLRLDDLEMKPLEFQSHHARYDLSVDIYSFEGNYRCDFEYNTDIFDASTMTQMQKHYIGLLETVASNPGMPLSAMSLLSERERHQMLEEWNRTEMPPPSYATVPAWFHAQAAKTPHATAIQMGRRSLTYAELDAQSSMLARVLRAHGVEWETVVGVFLRRSPEMVVALLGILKAGAAYLPLDPLLPAQRIEFLLADAEVPLILTQTDLRDTLPESNAALLLIDQIDRTGQGTEAPVLDEPIPEDEPGPEDLAYLIYTSGSTGNPKGTAIPQRALVNLLASMLREPGLSSCDTLAAITTLSFDIAGLEIFGPLVCGARLVLASTDQTLDPEALAGLLEQSEATVMQATPSTWRMLVDAGWMGGANLRMWCGGEALPPDLAENLLVRGRELWNLYGPTETTIWSAAHRVKSGENPILIGRPIANTRMYILDPDGQPVATGVHGELYIGGTGLARGYWRRPELTEARFVSDPFDTAGHRRIYRTGDLARYRPGGRIQLIGRTDHQIKLRGHRIELGEIETAIERHPEVLQAVVALHGEASDQRLTAYVKQLDGDVDPERLRPWLQARLPEYMVPSAFIAIAEIPLTPNGKIDRKRLAMPKASPRERSASSIIPRNQMEERLAKIWSEILGVDRPGVRDNFFDLGGHSLLLIRVHAMLRKELDAGIAVIDLFRYPTIETLAGWLERRRQAATLTAGVSS